MPNDADGIIANLKPFRREWVDVRAAFELGYICLRNKIVVRAKISR